MFVDVLGENVGNTFTLLLPLKDFLRKMVFVEVAGEDIHVLLAPQHAVHHTTGIHPVVENQDGLLRFEHKATMEDVGQRHIIFASVSTYLSCRWSTYLVSFGF